MRLSQNGTKYQHGVFAAICTVIPLGDGLLIDAITALVEAIEDPVQKAVSKEVFFGGNTLKRNSNLLTAMSSSLGLTDRNDG